MKSFISKESIVLLVILLSAICLVAEAQECLPGTPIKGTNPEKPCNQENESECCQEGINYPTYECSPPVSGSTKAILTLNGFEEGQDGGHASNCDGQFHDNNTPVVALSTGWYSNGERCQKEIIINGNGGNVRAKVVDECASNAGCDEAHSYQPPCKNNIVDASKAVWDALGVPDGQRDPLEITWSDS